MSNDSVTEVLFDKGTLMDLYIGKPTFQKKLRPSDMLLEGINEEVLYLGHKKLLPKKATEDLVTLEGLARVALASRSLPFPISGARFVYYRALPEVLRRLRGLRDRWDEAVEELVRKYPEFQEQQLALLDKQSEELADAARKAGRDSDELDSWLARQKANNRKLYPNVSEVPGMFKFTWRMFKINTLQGVEEMSTLEQDEVAGAQEQIRRELQQWVRAKTVELHQSLGEAALQAKNLLEKQGKLNPKNLRPLFEAFEQFKAMDITGASDFQRIVDEARAIGTRTANGELDFEITAQTVGSHQGFRDLLNTMSSLAVDETAEQAGIKAIEGAGEFRRVVEL